MELRETGTEEQVWHRVWQRQEPPREEIRLLVTASELAGIYRLLSGSFTGPLREKVKQLYEGELANAACLRGIGILSGQPEETVKLWSPARENPQRLLMACYHRTRRCMVEYMSRSAQAEYGCVYQALADREKMHCTLLAQLLGSWKD